MDTEAGETIEASSVIAWARQCETDFQQMLEEENGMPVKETQRQDNPWWRFW
jgi:hypothetical protein